MIAYLTILGTMFLGLMAAPLWTAIPAGLILAYLSIRRQFSGSQKFIKLESMRSSSMFAAGTTVLGQATSFSTLLFGMALGSLVL